MKKLTATITIGFVAVITASYLTLIRPQATNVVAVSGTAPIASLNSNTAQDSTTINDTKVPSLKPETDNNLDSTVPRTIWTKERLAELDEKYAQKTKTLIDNYTAMGFETDKKADYVGLSIADLTELYDTGDIYAIAELANRAYKSGRYDRAYRLRKENIGLGSMASALDQFLDMSYFLRKYEQGELSSDYLKRAANLSDKHKNYLHDYKLRMFSSALSAGYLGHSAEKSINGRIFRYLGYEEPKYEEFFFNNLDTIVRATKNEHNRFNVIREQRGIDRLETQADDISVESITQFMTQQKELTLGFPRRP